MAAAADAAETHHCDVLVIGTGAGGLSAAMTARKLGLDVLLVEKDAFYGGTTARPGGWFWIPCSPHARREGVRDSIEAARTFGRGSTAYNRSLGDPLVAPNPCAAPLKPPFYAVKVVPGDLGTFVGLRGDAHAQVLDRGGRPISGLHAASNALASVMGGNHPGGGIAPGPAMTFGRIAAHHLAGRAPETAAREEAPAAAAA